MSRHTLSSTAARAYWLGRYLERVEGIARLVHAHGYLFMDLPARLPGLWQGLVDITGGEAQYLELYQK